VGINQVHHLYAGVVPEVGYVILERGHVLVRKGNLLHAADVDELRERGVAELHLAVPSPDDVGEDEAIARLATTIAGTDVHVGKRASAR
jgi:molybdenum cofactor cytidylyltransferase